MKVGEAPTILTTSMAIVAMLIGPDKTIRTTMAMLTAILRAPGQVHTTTCYMAAMALTWPVIRPINVIVMTMAPGPISTPQKAWIIIQVGIGKSF